MHAIAERRLACRVIDVRRISGYGSVNRVYVVRAQSETVVVRISDKPSARAEFLKEKVCAELAREKGVRTPRILAVGFDFGAAFSVQEYIAGLNGKDAEDLSAIYRMFGRTARALHSIQPKGFGDRYDEELHAFTGFSPSWETHLDYNLSQLAPGDALIALDVYDSKDQPRLRALLSDLHKEDFSLGLVHGDLAPRNVICEIGGEFALIDWGTAQIGIVPHTELVELLRHHEVRSSAMRSFCQGYGLTAQNLTKMSKVLMTLSVLRSLDKLRWAISNRPEKVPEFVRTAKTALSTVL